ncbi:MAG: 2-oxoacid:acceptor oxidoreductase family protein [Lachnospiraceae bacterium]|nr:2-oxoacid:acceptor oxidoreductase family protein [Lachnospiraceae bacterium]
MSELVEIRWHGRGGQGAKTAALLLADVAFNIGKHVQGFPEYGPERMGAPITAYDRISDQEIRVHSNIYEPNYVVVVDETLLHTVDVTKGIKKGGAILINTERASDELMPELNGFEGRVYTINAREISEKALGKYFPNTPMLAAIVKITGLMEPEKFLEEMEKSLRHKFAKKPEVLEGNMNALRMALEQVRG